VTRGTATDWPNLTERKHSGRFGCRGSCVELRAAVAKYLDVVKEFGRPMPLAEFGVPKDELERVLSGWDEDYHLNRHFELIAASPACGLGNAPMLYVVNGLACSSIVFRETICHVFE
jgi:hypothetical protein